MFYNRSMSTPILATKLYVPSPRPRVVPRPRLIEWLNEELRPYQGFGRKLTLISAPAGFGKTTLISDWLQQSKVPAAWLSLDEGDNDPTRFLVYLVAALQTMPIAEGANIGGGVLAVLQSSKFAEANTPPPTETILTSLLNEITTIRDNFALVLDDYHVIEAKVVDQALTFLIEYLPPQMHLAITTREDPQLPLARLRARGQLTELRAADLRFTPGETTTFLNHVMGLNLSAEEVTSLETRTEGWIAGLQLAALSMRGREDVAGFIRAFTGDNRYIVDYLVEEVLQRQPERVRSFLLQTSILDRLSGPLCDAVTDQEDGREMLEALERGNLFVIPLDDQRQWYRYHHLFADVLQARLMKERPDRISILHQRASEWYEQNDLPADAIRHALAAADFERVADLLELAWPAVFRGFQPATRLGWVKALPDHLIRARPVLSIGYAWTLLDSGELEAAEARLRDAEWWLDTTTDMNERPEAPAPKMVVVNEKEFRSLPASIASARAYHAQTLGDVSSTVIYARRALNLLKEDAYYERGVAAMFLGLAYWTRGDLEAAHQALADSVASLHLAGKIYFQIVGTVFLAYIKMAQGRLQEAARTYEHILQLAVKQGEPLLLETADLYTGLSELHRERGDLETATQHVLKGKALDEQVELPGSAYRLCVAMARIKEVQGDLDGALDLFHEAERLYKRDPIPNLRPIAALKARVWVSQGRPAEALDWARERGLSADSELSYLHEFEHITLARILIAQYKSDGVERALHQAMGLLERLLKAAEDEGRMGSLIEILVLQALTHQAQGDIPSALVSLERALTLAEPEGYVRIFVDEGRPMRTLLREAAKHTIAERKAFIHYVSQLQLAFGKAVAPPVAEGRRSVTQLLSEPLSERELDVLRLLGTELNGPEIARELMVSLSTMRFHTRNIYSKLNVNNRRAAVRRAEELNLL